MSSMFPYLKKFEGDPHTLIAPTQFPLFLIEQDPVLQPKVVVQTREIISNVDRIPPSIDTVDELIES